MVFLFWLVVLLLGFTTENYRNDLKEINASHKEEVKAMTDAIANNTLVIQKLVDSLDDIKKV